MNDQDIKKFFKENIKDAPKGPSDEYQKILAKARQEQASTKGRYMLGIMIGAMTVALLFFTLLEPSSTYEDESWLFAEESMEEELIEDYLMLAESF